ncbi:HAS-barrel domain-containing protein [Geminocystis sp. NIES-3709]|uniref:HAS-barrel domain-containing protein n=1 Tax=Geminocystis sp. NIES-3709 TaxID=1617448 RepID=UPI0005FCC976|nr:HAS-barrel domain-containing protein [Geminocystis sp. NIES-3709]BAQ64197.1 Sll1318 protein [Geminocystis sp. NIES-3709]
MRLPLPKLNNDDRQSDHIGEVIETSTVEFLAQCLEPEELNFPAMPPFGSWVKSFDEESGNKIYSLVTNVTTAPIDSVHRARALGLTLTELKEQQPQIFAMLKTEFRAVIIGFEIPSTSESNSYNISNGNIYQYLPPRPPQIHQAVFRCDAEEIIKFTANPDFLRVLLQVQNTPVESLIAATLRESYRLRGGDRQWLVNAGRTLSVLLKNDYDCLKYILSQVHW